jgi:GxxExxY protein
MLESVYEGWLCHELAQAGIVFQRQAGIPVTCKGVQFDEGFRADILVDRQLIVAIKTVATIVPAYGAQVLTCLRMSGLRLGLLFNFHARLLQDGLRRFVV